MTYKTILVYLNDSRRAESVLEPAAELASRFNSHLIGFHAYSAVPASPIPMASSALGSIVAAARTNSESIADAFRRVTKGRPFVAEWELQKVPHVDLASIVLERGRTTDLIVAGQTDPDWDLSPLMDFPERLALESGRPVLVIPYAGRYSTVGRRVLIAWKSTREAARAVFDALPLLQGAKSVHILEIRGRAEDSETLMPDTSIAAALGRHGIKPEVRKSVTADISVGDEILSRAADLNADLLVMGAYGHARFRELVFGGVTRQICRQMTLPTLFSH
ncbi:MAG TPA: universal stress protein [Hyphomicrobiaceae bacterium]|nr:universal stress protein [Hyphomicrobiaceae bacterium]